MSIRADISVGFAKGMTHILCFDNVNVTEHGLKGKPEHVEELE